MYFLLGDNVYSILRHIPLFSTIPQFVLLNNNDSARILSKFLCSSIIRSIVTFELDDDCVLLDVFNDSWLFFPQSIQLTDIRVTLFQFDHCICLLNQLDFQLCSFAVSIMNVSLPNVDILSKIKSVSNKHFLISNFI